MQDHHSTDHTMPAEAETSSFTASSNLLHRHCVNASRYVNRKAKLLRSSYEGLSFLNSPLSCSMQRRYVNLLIFYVRVKITRVKSRPPVFITDPGCGFENVSGIRISPKKKLQVKIFPAWGFSRKCACESNQSIHT